MDGDQAPEPERLALRRRSKWLVRLAWLVGLVVVVAVGWQVTTNPDDLPTSGDVVTASTPAGRPVFVGVFATPGDFDRSIEISGVKVFATAPGPVTVTPHLCRGGSVGVTTDPTLFCSELVPTEGATMKAGDEIVLEVVGDVPGQVVFDRIRVAYREDFQWATQTAGRPAVVEIV
jgi:hypothetical protein